MESDDYAKYYWHNYMTRFFSGTAHTGAIGERELESAKARLSGVDVLIDLMRRRRAWRRRRGP